MSRPNHVRAPGERRGLQGLRRAAWVRPFRRVHRALDATLRLIGSSVGTVAATGGRAHRRPVRASQDLLNAEDLLIRASSRLMKAARELAETNACIAREPESAAGVPALLVDATERWAAMAGWLDEAAAEVFSLHRLVLDGLETGTLVPERPSGRRPRIVLAPRPVPIRAFLRLRQPRVVDRIAPLLLRRRRTPRPAALRVPRRSVLGRAPPLLFVCLL